MQDNKIKIIIIILVVLIFVVAIGGTVLYLTTDMFKSSQVLFQKYISQNIQDIVDVCEVNQEEQTVDLLRKSDYVDSTNATLKYLEKENDEEEIYQIKANGINKASENAVYESISASYGNNVIMSVDLLGQNNTYGFRLANLVQQFVSAENATVSYFVSSMGLDGSMFTEKLQPVDVTGLLDLSDEDVQQLIKTYIYLMLTDIDKSHYSSSKNAVITLQNKESVTTNAYTLTVTKNELDKLYKKILNQAMNDKIILGKIDNVDNKIKEAGFAEPEGKSLREQYIQKIQEKIDGLEYQGEDTSKITITVNEKDGVTVRTTMKTEDSKYVLDVDETQGKTVSLETTQKTDQEEVVKTYAIGRNENDKERKRIISYSEPTQSIDVALGRVQTDTGMTLNVEANYKSDEISNIDLTSQTDIKMAANEAIPVNFDDKNNIVLNNYEGLKIYSILDSLKNRAIKSLEDTQAKINTKLLNRIILKIDEKEQKKKQDEEQNAETKKEQFNNKFVLYEGEDIEQEYVLKLIKTAGENMTDYQVVSGTHLKLFIKEGVKNENKANAILTAIENSRDSYNIKLNYNDQGYVDTIDIMVYEKN